MIKNFDELCKICYKLVDGQRPGSIELEMQDRSSKMFYISRLIKCYFNAKESAKRFGYVGVGQITFAEARLKRFQERLKHVYNFTFD